ncbi:MAG: hypothetical protein OEM52_06175 [bacterium]|nr:hypothetical protein [bacterium]
MVRFGELVVQEGWISPDQLSEALTIQQNGTLRFGEFLMRQGMLQPFHVELALTVQKTSPKSEPIGKIVQELGFLQKRQVEQAAQFQQAGRNLLGEILVDLGHITPEQRDLISGRLPA